MNFKKVRSADNSYDNSLLSDDDTYKNDVLSEEYLNDYK